MKKFFPVLCLIFLTGTTLFAQEGAMANPYKDILLDKSFSFSFVSLVKGIIGMAAIIFVCWCLSSNRKAINWGSVGKALLFQFAIAVSVLAFPAVQSLFEFLGSAFVAILGWTKAGSNFLFGSFMDTSRFGFIFIFQILPTIVFFSALMSLLFYLGIIQKIVYVMGWLFTKFMRLSGAEALCCAGNIFLGQCEAPLMVKEYVPKMTRSELMLVMTCGMSTMAGGVMAAYIAMLGGGDKIMEIEFAKHLLSASVMAAPGAVALSKILVPQSEEIDNTLAVSKEKLGKNVLDAISNGTSEGLKLAANVAAMLLVFYALIAGVNEILGWISFPAVDDFITELSGGRYTNLSLEAILAFVFYPIIWLIGVPGEDIGLVGRLLGEKLILTEFVGYQSLATMIREGVFASPKSVIMATYVLCGFANFASVGILIGGVGGIAPNRKHILSEYGFKSFLASALVALMSAAIVGMFI
ncbi:MAG: Na+ dependent nucleoside transporter [Bacteroidales bacterium]|nr:Na+ dependent nucleoside transporter [Bacteroidales bacterium]